MGEERRGKREKIGEREEWEEKRKENRGKREGAGRGHEGKERRKGVGGVRRWKKTGGKRGKGKEKPKERK